MAQTITDLGFVGGKHLYHLKVTDLELTADGDTVINMPCDQIQAVVGGALDADGLRTSKSPCWQPGDHQNWTELKCATLSLFVLGL